MYTYEWDPAYSFSVFMWGGGVHVYGEPLFKIF